MKPGKIEFLKLLLLFILFLTAQSCQPQKLSANNFTETGIPKLRSEELNDLNHRPEEFSVRLENGELKIESAGREPETIEYNLPNGKLLGIDYGEFGGGLYYKPNDTTLRKIYVNGKLRSTDFKGNPFSGGLMASENDPINNRIKGTILLKSGNIKKIFSFQNSLYTMEGLVHLSLSFGEFNQVQIRKDSVYGKLALKLDDSPMAFDIHHDTIYLATNNRFYTIHNWKPTLVIDNLFWKQLHPNSVTVKDSKHVYIGMRAGYAMINTDTRKVTFYKYNVPDN